MKDADMNGYLEKKNIQPYALIVNLPIGINPQERRNNFFTYPSPVDATIHYDGGLFLISDIIFSLVNFLS